MNECNDVVVERLNTLINSNREDHAEIIRHQKHTNGDVSKLKDWMNRVVGGLVVITAIGSFISTFYFIERNDQNEKFEQVIKMQEQINNLAYQLNRLDLAE